MSLTSMLKSKKEADKKFQSILREIILAKNDFSTLSGKQAFSRDYTVLVPYNLAKPYDSSVVGTAFDYMARAMIARVVTSNQEDFFVHLVAEHGLEIMQEMLKENKLTTFKLNNKYKKSIKRLKSFIRGKEDISTLITTACFLAKLEHVYRSGKPPVDMKEAFFSGPEEEIKRELEAMTKVFQEKFLIPEVISEESEVVYNPRFGVASYMIGGADGDVIIDGVLYDFKTSKGLGYKWQEVAQIVGYYFLNEISLNFKIHNFPYDYDGLYIKQVAFYKARYGEIEYFDMSFFDKKTVEQITKAMILHLKENPTSNILFNYELFNYLQDYTE